MTLRGCHPPLAESGSLGQPDYRGQAGSGDSEGGDSLALSGLCPGPVALCNGMGPACQKRRVTVGTMAAG